jgi:hypothetical protein
LSGGILMARFDTMLRPRSERGNWYAGEFPDQETGLRQQAVTGRSNQFQTRLADMLTFAHDRAVQKSGLTFTPTRHRHSMRRSLPDRVAAGADSIGH